MPCLLLWIADRAARLFRHSGQGREQCQKTQNCVKLKNGAPFFKKVFFEKPFFKKVNSGTKDKYIGTTQTKRHRNRSAQSVRKN